MSFVLAFSTINCTRLLLNIRRAYYIGSDNVVTGPTPQSSVAVAAGSRLQAPVSFARRCRQEDSLDLDRYGEIEVAVCVEVTRTFDDGDAGDLQYEMTDMMSSAVV